MEVWRTGGQTLTGEMEVWRTGEQTLTGEMEVWSTGGQTLTGENGSSRRKSCRSATVSTSNYTGAEKATEKAKSVSVLLPPTQIPLVES